MRNDEFYIILTTYIISFVTGIIVGIAYEEEKFNNHLFNNDGYYWIDASGNRAYTTLEECGINNK